MMLIVALALDAGNGVSAVINSKDGTVYTSFRAPPHMSGALRVHDLRGAPALDRGERGR